MTAPAGKPPRVLIIAGSDSGGGAGIQADIKTVTMLGGHAMTAITAITAQNTLGVTGVWPLPAEAVIAQIDAVVADLSVDAVKIGMIGSAEVAVAVAERLDRDDLAAVPVVFDPVMIATSGSRLADAETVGAFEKLMACATVITPNIDELSVLANRSIETRAEVTNAADALIYRCGCAVLATGYHDPPGGELRIDDFRKGRERHRTISSDARLYDLLFTGGPGKDFKLAEFFDERIDTIHDHGTGCTLASGIAVGLGAGLALVDAIGRARDYVRAALLAAPGYGAGHGPMGHTLGLVPFDLPRPDISSA